MKNFDRQARLYGLALALALLVGSLPTVFNVVVDPYDRHGLFDLGVAKAELGEKSHYPLWKVFRYDSDNARTIILGDSRARALRDKLWHKLGVTDAYNFAYGAATVPEIDATFQLVKQNPQLETLIVGVPLRMFGVGHRDDLNRVPEAIELSDDLVAYYTSWFVAKVGWRQMTAHYAEQIEQLYAHSPQLIGQAAANPLQLGGGLTLSDLLDPDICNECDLPQSDVLISPVINGFGRGLGRGYGAWDEYWPQIALSRELSGVFARQVSKNARSDWNSFKFSEDLWAKIIALAAWCDENDVELIFFIPPTISDMQARIADFNLGPLNHEFRLRLASLADVVDFDFDTGSTRNLERFSDAYHFKADFAAEIVGELTQLVSPDSAITSRARERRGQVICPILAEDETSFFTDGITQMREGQGCRIWRNGRR